MAHSLAQGGSGVTGRLDSHAVLEQHLDGLVALDPRLAPVRDFAGTFSVRESEQGFPALVAVVTGQQVSAQAARAIWTKVAALPGVREPAGLLALSDEQLRGAGLSSAKVRTARLIAEAVLDGSLDLPGVESQPVEAAIAHMTRLKGVGPWTAEIYLLFAARHPDVFPAGDLALQIGAQWGLGLEARPSPKQLAGEAEKWSPYRSSAALLFWAYYAARKSREGMML